MKKILLLIAFITLFISCNKKENELNLSKIKVLEQKLHSEKSNNKLLKETIYKRNDSIKKINTDLYNNHIQTKEVSKFIESTAYYAFKHNKIIKHFFNLFDLKNKEVGMSIIDSHVLRDYTPSLSSSSDDINLFSLFISRIDRSPENIKELLSPNAKSLIYSLLEENDIYTKSGASLMVNCLLLAYNDLNDDTLDKIYKLSSTSDEYDRYSTDSKLNTYINSIVLDEIKEVLTNQYELNHSNISKPYSRIRLIYTFWARRNKEGNEEVIYTFLSELHHKLMNEETQMSINTY